MPKTDKPSAVPAEKSKDEFDQILDSVSLDKLLGSLKVVNENIMAEAAEQPILFMQAAAYRVQRMRATNQAVAAYESERGMASLDIRNERNDNDKKPTEGEVTARLACDPEVQRLTKKRDRAYEVEEYSKLVLEAYRQRRDSIRIIADSFRMSDLREMGAIEREQEHRKMRETVMDLQHKRRSGGIE